MSTYALVVAGGQGKRFGGPKQFALLGGRPLLHYSLETFESCPSIDRICLVVPSNQLDEVHQLKRLFKKVGWVVPGGTERQHSVLQGFEALPVCDRVLVHDGVRPFIDRELVEKIIGLLKEHPGVVPALPLHETVKEADARRFITRTVDRSLLWAAQTPQGFQYATLKAAFAKAKEEEFVGTDEASLVERLGVPVRLIEGSPTNLKITTTEDMARAEWQLREARR